MTIPFGLYFLEKTDVLVEPSKSPICYDENTDCSMITFNQQTMPFAALTFPDANVDDNQRHLANSVLATITRTKSTEGPIHDDDDDYWLMPNLALMTITRTLTDGERPQKDDDDDTLGW